MNEKKLINDMVKVIKRLSINETSMRFTYNNFLSMTKKIESKGTTAFTLKDKQIVSEYFELMFYRGKVMAYFYVLEQLVGEVKARALLLKGILGDKRFDKYGQPIIKKKYENT